MSYCRVFGFQGCYPVTMRINNNLDPRARKVTLIFYAPVSRGYKLLYNEEQKGVVTRDVRF